MNYLLGSTGILGSAFMRSDNAQENVIVSRNEYLSWISSQDNAYKFFEEKKLSCEDVIIVCAGVTDPRATEEELNLVNLALPKKILQAAEYSGPRIITFGSVLENFPTDNPYLSSKREFFNYLKEESNFTNFEHWQLHTIYGFLPPKSHFFLGQIMHALKSNSKFEMTSGNQLREYWHAEDVVNFIASQEKEREPRQIDVVGTGVPLTLRALAEAIFLHFNLIELLEVGSMVDPALDNYSLNLGSTRGYPLNYMREQIAGVIECLDQHIKGVLIEKR